MVFVNFLEDYENEESYACTNLRYLTGRRINRKKQFPSFLDKNCRCSVKGNACEPLTATCQQL